MIGVSSSVYFFHSRLLFVTCIVLIVLSLQRTHWEVNFSGLLESANVERVVSEADGYQPHLVAPEMGYRRLLQECLVLFKVRSAPCDLAGHRCTPLAMLHSLQR